MFEGEVYFYGGPVFTYKPKFAGVLGSTSAWVGYVRCFYARMQNER